MRCRSKSAPVQAVVVGAGPRGTAYADYALQHPDRMKVVAVADPNPQRREHFAKAHFIDRQMQFETYQQLVARGVVAAAAINGTNDQLHFESSMALIEAGYHMLLEKPIAQCEQHVRKIIDAAQQYQRTVMVCHVLRYAPFYQKIKQLVDEGQVGSIVAIHSCESISYHHMATAYIRGLWNRRETSNPILMAKCCHDLDIITWLMAPTTPLRVASFGSLLQFKSENAPRGAALRCLDGCRIENRCPYSAKLNYVQANRWPEYAWGTSLEDQERSEEDKLQSLRTDNPYGRCVWHCDNNVVDHQTVIIEFASGATCAHNLFCATTRPTRTIHILGTQGEIQGNLEEGQIMLRHPSTNPKQQDVEQTFNTGAQRDSLVGHGGGDERLIADFVANLRGDPTAKTLTHIEESLTSHLIAFAADKAMQSHQVIELAKSDVSLQGCAS